MIAVGPIVTPGVAVPSTGVSERRERELAEGATLAVLLQGFLAQLAPPTTVASNAAERTAAEVPVSGPVTARATIPGTTEPVSPEPRGGVQDLGWSGSGARAVADVPLPTQPGAPEASSEVELSPVRGPEPEDGAARRELVRASEPRLQLVAVHARTVAARREPGAERPSLQGAGIAYDAGVLLTVEGASSRRPVPARVAHQEPPAEASVPVEPVALPERRLAVELRDERLGRVDLRIEQVRDRYEVHLRVQEGEAARLLQHHHDGLRRELAEVLAGDVRLHLGAGARGDGYGHGRSADDGAPPRDPRRAPTTHTSGTDDARRAPLGADAGVAERRRWRVHHEA